MIDDEKIAKLFWQVKDGAMNESEYDFKSRFCDKYAIQARWFYQGYEYGDKEAEEEKRELINAILDAFKYIDSDSHKFKYKIRNNVIPIIIKPIDEVIK